MATKKQNDLIASLLSQLGSRGDEWQDYTDGAVLHLIDAWEEEMNITVAEASEIIDELKETKQKMER